VKNGRNYVGTELDKRYYELSLERIKNSWNNIYDILQYKKRR
jgi:DNA modification methylase